LTGQSIGTAFSRDGLSCTDVTVKDDEGISIGESSRKLLISPVITVSPRLYALWVREQTHLATQSREPLFEANEPPGSLKEGSIGEFAS